MLNNLSAEMARYGISINDIKTLIGKSDRTTRDKIRGRYDFSLPEAILIRDKLFPSLTIEYLFAKT